MSEKKKSDVGPVCPPQPESPSASLPCPAEEETNREDDKGKAANKESKPQNVEDEPEEEVPFCKTNDEESTREAEEEDAPACPARPTLPIPEEPKNCPPEHESFVAEQFKGICPPPPGMKCSAHACNTTPPGIGKGSSGNVSSRKSKQDASCPPSPDTKNKTCRQERHCEKH